MLFDDYDKIDFYQRALDKKGLVEVTIWYKIKGGKVVYSHAEIGHTNSELPTFESGNGCWIRSRTYAKKATCWYVESKNGTAFNHLEDGHNSKAEPVGIDDYQKKAWKGQKWVKQLTYITEDNLVLT